jgi:uncharacterized protein (TIGR03435 family)
MKRDDENLDEILDRHLPSAAKGEMEEDGDRVWSRLRSRAEDRPLRVVLQATPVLRWRPVAAILAAAAVLAVAFIGTRPGEAFAIVERVDGALYRFEDAKTEVMASGDELQSGDTVRTNGGSGTTLVLADGSRVEMRSRSELTLEQADEGIRLRLRDGSVIVNAAKQNSDRHLYVQTKDMTVSVVGTVFLVNAEEEGSRVAVIEGEVRVQQGAAEKKVRPGEQVMTKPIMEWQPVSEEIAWSRSREAHLAMLQQSVASPAEPRESFDVVSVRPSAALTGTGERSGARGVAGGVPRRNPRTPGEPCSSRSEPVVDPRRFDAANATLHALVAWAYGFDCEVWGRSSGGSEFIFGGPGWTKDEGFDIQAVIPEGTPSYTADQFRAHNAPKLQKMLQSMLEDRFKFVMHREIREMQVYVLTVAQGGPRFLAKPVNPNPVSRPGQVFAEAANVGLRAWKEGDNPCCKFTFDGTIWAQKESMAHFASTLASFLGQPVLDQTGLTGDFNYLLRFQPRTPPAPNAPDPARMIEQDLGIRFSAPGTRSLFAALEQDFGLRLESKNEKIEVLVIDRVEKPTEN